MICGVKYCVHSKLTQSQGYWHDCDVALRMDPGNIFRPTGEFNDDGLPIFICLYYMKRIEAEKYVLKVEEGRTFAEKGGVNYPLPEGRSFTAGEG